MTDDFVRSKRLLYHSQINGEYVAVKSWVLLMVALASSLYKAHVN